MSNLRNFCELNGFEVVIYQTHKIRIRQNSDLLLKLVFGRIIVSNKDPTRSGSKKGLSDQIRSRDNN